MRLLSRIPPWPVYLLLAVLLTWPLALDPAGQVAGGARTDAPNAIWSIWFWQQSLAEGNLPLQTHLLNHPFGGRLVVADPLNALLGYPLALQWGPAAAYSALVIAHLCFAGAAAHALGRRLGGGGWVAGVGFMVSPMILSNIQNGSSEAVAAGWLPLAILWLIRAIEEGGAGRVLLAGLGLFLAAVGAGWYAGVGAFLVAGALAVAGWRDLPWRLSHRRLIPALLIGLALAAPAAVAIKSVAVAEDGLVEIKAGEDLARIRRTLGPLDPRVLVVPGDFASPDFARLEGNPSDRRHISYLGFVLIALVGWRLLRGSPGEAARSPALWLALFAGLVLAMGPVLVIGGFPQRLLGRALPLPYALLEGLPGFSALSLLYRLAEVSVLLLAVMADRARPAWALIVAAEALLISPARGLPEVTTLPVSSAIAALEELPQGAVLNVPVVPGRNYLYEQVQHRKPVIGSLNTSVNRPGLDLLAAARRLKKGEWTKEQVAAVAQQWQIRYVVSHKNVFSSEAFLSATIALSQTFPKVAEDDRVTIYQLY